MDLRRLLVVTTGVTAVTALVGVFTAASGAGLTCEARWPLCDGAVFGLFPANFMSFIEWSHRLVAAIAGLLILASAWSAYRGGHPRRIRLATLLAVVLTPLQVVLGAFTVLVYEFFFGYSILVLTAHFGAASLILAALVAATVWAYADVRSVSLAGVRTAGVGALVGFPFLVAFAPRVFVPFGEVVQFAYYGVGFATFAALCVLALWAREIDTEATRSIWMAGIVAAVLVVAQLIVARRAFGDTGQLFVVGLSLSAFVLSVVAVWRCRSLEAPPAMTAVSD